MMDKEELDKRFYEGRRLETTSLGIPHKPTTTICDKLDLVKLLRGTWNSRAEGWNLIALPASPSDLIERPADSSKSFRLLMNQYGETLKFNVPDTGVPNRGMSPEYGESDQLIDAITYEQIVVQKAFKDFPESKPKKHAKNGEPIHHEPGFFLQFLNQVQKGTSPDVTDDFGNVVEKDLEIARMGTIPHGNSLLAMGFVSYDKTIENNDAFPERLKADGDGKEIKVEPSDLEGNPDLTKYLAPYKHFKDHHFFGCADRGDEFPGFSPDNVHAILQHTQKKLKNIKNTTVLNFDTKFKVNDIDNDAVFDQNDKPIAGFPISNAPFVKRQANVTEMHATFWIMELEPTNACEPPEFVMQYSQTVYLEFFNSPVDKDEKGNPRRIRWPHISINTLRKID